MRQYIHIGIVTLLLLASASAQDGARKKDAENGQNGGGYKIEQPGTITFTVGIKIKGKVEKPQVVIFLPKERSQFRDLTFDHSFIDDILKPLPFEPVAQ